MPFRRYETRDLNLSHRPSLSSTEVGFAVAKHKDQVPETLLEVEATAAPGPEARLSSSFLARNVLRTKLCSVPDNVIPFLRITVIGDADSGKTSLINAWVNNSCSTSYTPTLDPTLYHRTMKIPNPLEEEETVTALIEIEDTYAPIRTGGIDMYGQKRDVDELIEVKPPPREPVVTPQYYGPFAEYEALTQLEYRPLSRCRMGFLLVFDATVEESLKTAMEMFNSICLQSATKTTVPRGGRELMPDPFFRPDETLPVAGLARRSGPATAAERAGLSAPRGVSAPRGATRDQSDALDEGCRFEAKGISVFLVANKIDKEPLAEETQKTMAAARAFAEIKELPYFEVSALKFLRVRKLFREMVEHIVLQPGISYCSRAAGGRTARFSEGCVATRLATFPKTWKVVEETLAPELYYKTMSVPAPSGTSAPPIPILVEMLERSDTFAPSAEGVGLMEQFLTSQRDHVKSEHLELLAGFNLPEAGEYRPLSKTRMGFLLVFDVWSEASLQEAIKLHRGLQDHGGADGSVLCLVGNKADRAAGAQEQIRAAQRYAAENELMFFQLAATDLRKVRLLFRQLLSAIYAKPQLWRLDRPRRRVGSRVEERRCVGVAGEIDHVDYDDGGNPVEDTEALEQEARQAEEALRHLEATRAPERRDEVPTAEMAGPEGAREEDLAEMPPEEGSRHAADEVPSEPAAQTAERPRSSVPMVVRKVPDPTEEEVRSPRGAAVEHEVPPQIHEPAPMPEEVKMNQMRRRVKLPLWLKRQTRQTPGALFGASCHSGKRPQREKRELVLKLRLASLSLPVGSSEVGCHPSSPDELLHGSHSSGGAITTGTAAMELSFVAPRAVAPTTRAAASGAASAAGRSTRSADQQVLRGVPPQGSKVLVAALLLAGSSRRVFRRRCRSGRAAAARPDARSGRGKHVRPITQRQGQVMDKVEKKEEKKDAHAITAEKKEQAPEAVAEAADAADAAVVGSGSPESAGDGWRRVAQGTRGARELTQDWIAFKM
eukprot:g19566.t1